MVKYTANKVKGTGRESWSLVFRHPVRKDQSGKVGLRIRRGLGTTDETEAQRLVDQLNEILKDTSLWDISAKQIALTRYDAKIVAAFYDALEPKQVDYQKLREIEMPLPTSKEDFARVLLVGTTGAGKTTLLRQLIGSDPKKDRFPSTSPNKTTVSDIEVICSPGEYQAVVTFFELREIRLHVEDCVMAAILAKVNGLDNATVAQRLLEHSEQRFRFFYVLGTPDMDQTMDDDDWDEDEEDEQDFGLADGLVSQEERVDFAAVLRGFLVRVEELAVFSEKVKEQLSKDLSVNLQTMSPSDRVAIEELLDEEIRQSKDFHSLVDDMVDKMAERFKVLNTGDIEFDADEWPTIWRFSTKDRDTFIENVRRLSSNYAPHFGKLLTPLVQGIRVKGPFKPNWYDTVPRLVLIDGQGIGHTASTSSSLPTQTSRKFDSSDVVLLVDSAKHPMQAGSLSVMRSLAASGHIPKLRICFTHVDELKGDSLPTRKSRIAHVKASLNQAISHIRENLGHEVALNLDVELADRSFFLENINQLLLDKEKHTLTQLQELVKILETSIYEEFESDAVPFYDEANLIIAVQNATRRFHQPWHARLGYTTMSGEPAQHWTRIKALARRLAYVYDDGEYDGLRPVGELKERLMEHIRIYLNQPVRWIPGSVTDEDRKAAVDKIARKISPELLEIATKRIWSDHLTSWNTAFDFSGRGSTKDRAETFQKIYNQAAPIPGEAGTANSHEFLSSIRQLVKEAITSNGGKVL